MVNIAMIGHKRIPSREGGIEIVVDELATRMAAKGHKVIAYNRKGHNVAGAEFDGNVHSANKPFVYNGVRVVPVPTFEAKGLAALTSSFFATLKAIAAKPDVIHYHAEGPCVMLRLAHWAGIRTVATIHGLDWQRAKWGKFASTYLKFGERTAAKYADEIIVLSESMRQYFQENMVAAHISFPMASNMVSRFRRRKLPKIWSSQERLRTVSRAYCSRERRALPYRGVQQAEYEQKACHRWRRFRLQRVLPAYSADG